MSEYNAVHIQVLEWPEAVRKRPGMYIGSTGERGLHHMAQEVLQAAANEVLSGRASRVEAVLTADSGLRVSHDGARQADLTRALTVLPTCWDGPRGRELIAWGASCLAVVNALSVRLVAEEHRDGTTVRQEYVRGGLLVPPTVTGPTDRTGTTVTFHPDPEVFGTAAFDADALVGHLRELALLNRALDIVLTDERSTPPRTERLHHPAGLVDFTTRLGGDPAATLTVEAADERMGGTLDLALCWTGGGGLHGFANSRRTDEQHSTHLLGFRDGLAAALGRSGLPAGLTAVVSVKLDAPEFGGATRRRLDNGPVRAGVAAAVRQAVEHRHAGRG
ncbi:DNA gyrase subunit B [Kitasatospora cineracea]|uniref:DNA gyrase subunit B n=1 Tax=Kitasatospora cineracea TaxID=88074 RepID=UPI00380659BB